MKKTAIVLVCLVGTIFYLASQVFLSTVDRRLSISTFTESGQGLSIFHQLAVERGAHQLETAVLRPALLREIDTLVVTSPLMPFSRHEAELVAKFVEGGGTLFASYHDEQTQERIKDLLAQLGGLPPSGINPDFNNGVAQALSPDQPTFYSRLIFNDDSCKRERLKCFLRDWQQGDGHVIAMVGVPVFANSMLNLGNNMSWSAKFLAKGGELAFDEYHHQFSDKSLTDLLLEPTFSLPALGLLAVILLFLAFGDDVLRDKGAGLVPRPAATRTYQELNIRFLRGALAGDKAASATVAKMASFLQQRYPHHRFEPPPASQPAGKAAATLLAIHRQILQDKGWSAGP